MREWRLGKRHDLYAVCFMAIYLMYDVYMGTPWSADLDRILLVRLGAFLFLWVVIIWPAILVGFFVSGAATFVFLVLAPSLNEVRGWSLVLPAAIGAYLLRRGRKTVFHLGPVVYAQLGVTVMLVLGIVYTREYDYAVGKVWRYLYYNLVPFICPLFFSNDEKRLRHMVLSFWAGIFVWALGGPFVLEEGIGGRLSPELSGPIGYGRMAALAVIFVMWFVTAYRGRGVAKAVSIVVGIWSTYYMGAAGTRGVLIALIIAVIAMTHGYFGRMISVRASLIWTICVIVVGFVLSYGPREGVERLISAESYRAEITSVSVHDRAVIYREAWNMFMSSPLIGRGTGAFVRVSNYPHNIFLEVGVEGGLIGLAFFMLFIILTVRYGWQVLVGASVSDEGRRMMLLLFGGFVFILVEAQFSLDILGNRAIWFLSGLIWAVYKSVKGKEEWCGCSGGEADVLRKERA